MANAATPEAHPILVTGAAGFIGARLVDTLAPDLKAAERIISVDDPKYFTERKEHSGIHFGKIWDRAKLFDELPKLANSGRKPRVIFHLGACTDTTELDVKYLNEMNLEYSKKLWNFCASQKIPLVYASSAATYGDGSRGFDDDEAQIEKLEPLNPYGDSKQQFDLWALAQEKRGVAPPRWSGFKFFNVYGYGERHKEKMASVFLHAFDQIRATGRMKLFKSHKSGIADGHQSRDFIYVEDVVRVLRFAAEHPLQRGIYNLGTGQARTWLDLVGIVFKTLGLPEQIDFIDTPEVLRKRYQYFTQADMSKLKFSGFKTPFTSLEDGGSAYVKKLSCDSLKS